MSSIPGDYGSCLPTARRSSEDDVDKVILENQRELSINNKPRTRRSSLLLDIKKEDNVSNKDTVVLELVSDNGRLEEREEVFSEIPREPLKTLLSGIFLMSGFLATLISLSMTHERVPETDPLPDVILDNVRYISWGLSISEILLMVSTISAFLVVISHTHRLVILRRIWLVMGLLYFYRAVTMFVTVLPKPDHNYQCHTKSTNYTVGDILSRVVILASGGGLSINGHHIYCGDYIFSGHTVTLTLGYLVIKQYSPAKYVLLHWISLTLSLLGVLFLMVGRGHYSIDVLLAYYLTTRLWWIYHTMANNNNLKTPGDHNSLANMGWWHVFRYFEEKTPAPLPSEYSLPIPNFVIKMYNRTIRAIQ